MTWSTKHTINAQEIRVLCTMLTITPFACRRRLGFPGHVNFAASSLLHCFTVLLHHKDESYPGRMYPLILQSP